MKAKLISVLIASILIAPAIAQQKADDQGAQRPPATATTAELADGEVRKVDRDARKVTIRHGEIKSLDMPPMTMVFQVRDNALLDKLKAGDKIRFVAEKSAAGYMVTDVQPVR